MRDVIWAVADVAGRVASGRVGDRGQQRGQRRAIQGADELAEVDRLAIGDAGGAGSISSSPLMSTIRPEPSAGSVSGQVIRAQFGEALLSNELQDAKPDRGAQRVGHLVV